MLTAIADRVLYRSSAATRLAAKKREANERLPRSGDAGRVPEGAEY